MPKLIKALICMIRGHFYRPSYQAKSILSGKYSRYRKIYFCYTCDRCEQKTKWLPMGQFDSFNAKYCPTWGNPGSDSQGYRKKD